MLLCIAMVLGMTACADSESTVETTSAADTYLSMAQEFLAQEKYDSAIDVLNQAKTKADDPRLDAMIAEIEAARPVFLEVAYTADSSNLQSGDVQIHSVTAEVLENTVRYDIAYTASEGMYLKIPGTDLDLCWDYLTPGGEDIFSFELDKTIARDSFQTIKVLFKYSSFNYMQLNITTQWQDAVDPSLVQIPVSNASNANCSVDLVTVRAVNENLLHFHVEYTTPTDVQYLAGFSFLESGEDMFYSVGVSPGKDMVSLMMDRAELETIDAIYVRLFQENNWDEALVVAIRSSDYTLPQAPSTSVTELYIDNPEQLPVELQKGKNLQLDSVLVQQSPAGNLYTLKGDFSETAVNTAYCNVTSLFYTITTRVTDPQQMQFFIPAEYLTRTVGLFLECWGPGGYIATIPVVYDYTPVAVSVLHPVKADDTLEAPELGPIVLDPIRSTDNQLTKAEVEIFGLTESILENGNTRYVLEYRATAGMNLTAFDPPNGDAFMAWREQVTSGRREYFVFDVEKEIMDQIDYITFNFWSDAEDGHFWIYLEKNWYNAQVTDGNPVGQAQNLDVQSDKKVEVHSVNAQQLDNGYVRYTVEYTTSAGRNVSFFAPYDDPFIYLSETKATGGRDTYIIDIPQEYNDAVTSNITMKFYELPVRDHTYARFKPASF